MTTAASRLAAVPPGNVSAVREANMTSTSVGRAPGTSLWDSKVPRSLSDSFTRSYIPLLTCWEPTNLLGARVTSPDQANGTCLREPYPHKTLIWSTAQAQIWESGLPGIQPPSKNHSTCSKTTFPFGEVGSRRPADHSFQQGVGMGSEMLWSRAAAEKTPRAREGVIQAGFMALFIYDCFSLEYSLFTMLYSFLLNNNMNQL